MPSLMKTFFLLAFMAAVLAPTQGLWAQEKTVALPYQNKAPAQDADIWKMYNAILKCNKIGKVYAPSNTLVAKDADGCVQFTMACQQPPVLCTPNWTTTTATACSATCGGGTQTATQTDGCGHTRTISQSCNTQACCTPQWRVAGEAHQDAWAANAHGDFSGFIGFAGTNNALPVGTTLPPLPKSLSTTYCGQYGIDTFFTQGPATDGCGNSGNYLVYQCYPWGSGG